MARRLRIAMIGGRGVPATYGGIERHVEEIGRRLAARGHEVTVYCRTNYVSGRESEYDGMRLRYLPSWGMKHADAITHSAASSCDALRAGYDVVHYHAVGPGLTAPMTRYTGAARVVLTVHGLDGERAKWGGVAQKVLRTATWMSARVPHATVVVSEALAEHYRATYRRPVHHIPNGVTPHPAPPASHYLPKLGLEPGGYVLFVGRFVPEKAVDRLLRAYAHVPGDMRLVLAGGSSFTGPYTSGLKQLANQDPRVVLPGYVHGEDLHALYAYARLFVLPSDLEGLPLTLLEAGSFGTPVLTSRIAPHEEVLGRDRPGRRLVRAGSRLALTEGIVASLGEQAEGIVGAAALREEILARYSWDRAVDCLEELYLRQDNQREGSRRPASGRSPEPVTPAGGAVIIPLRRRGEPASRTAPPPHQHGRSAIHNASRTTPTEETIA